MAEESILIIGAANIAKALGLSTEHVKTALVGQADFPILKNTTAS